MALHHGCRPRQPATTGMIGASVVEDDLAAERDEVMPLRQSSSQPASEWSPSMNTRSTPPRQREASSPERHTCQCTAGAARPRRRRARETARRVAHSVAPQPEGSASGWRPKGSTRCSSASERSAPHRATAEEPSYTPISTTRRAPRAAPSSTEASSAECIVRGGISPSRRPARAGGHRRAGDRASDGAGGWAGTTSQARPYALARIKLRRPAPPRPP